MSEVFVQAPSEPDPRRWNQRTDEHMQAPERGNEDYSSASRYLNLSEPVIRQAVDDGELVFMRFGKLVRFLRSDLDAFQYSRRVVRTPDKKK